MGPVFKQLGDTAHAFICWELKRAYETVLILAGNTEFQRLKYSQLMALPDVGHGFEWTKIGLGVAEGAIVMAYDYVKERRLNKSANKKVI